MNLLRTSMIVGFATVLLGAGSAPTNPPRGTGNLGLVIERADGSVLVVDNTADEIVGRVNGLGDLSHASVVFDPSGRYGFVFGRDGGLTKVDLLAREIEHRTIQAGNSIGGAISSDGRFVAVSNYDPGGVRLFAATDLSPVARIPATTATGHSKVVGLVDAPGNRLVYSLFDAGEIWITDLATPTEPETRRFKDVGSKPYDALLSPDGRWYMAGLFGEDGVARIDLWHPERGVQKILAGYGKGTDRLPVYKMPHLEGWAVAGENVFLPAVGRHQVLVASLADGQEKARIDVHSQPVFVMARPDGRELWINFAYPDNDTIQIVDTESFVVKRTFKPGPGVLHMEFHPRAPRVWVSVRDANEVQIYDTRTYAHVATLPARTPSGIFFTARAHRLGL